MVNAIPEVSIINELDQRCLLTGNTEFHANPITMPAKANAKSFPSFEPALVPLSSISPATVPKMVRHMAGNCVSNASSS
ncbi:hypothetical protein D3C86_2110170 [compost metagenome]